MPQSNLAYVAHDGTCAAKQDITQHEIAALKTRFNLADAHTHQRQSTSQRRIVDRLPELWYAAEQQTQHQSEQEFIEAFYGFHGQHRALRRRDDIYLVYAASVAMHITATYLQQKKMRVGLIEPCFDNLHDLMKHMQVPLVPLKEDLLADPSQVYANLALRSDELDAVFLVDPNNPTGFSVCIDGARPLHEVVRFCVDHDKLLIIDLCFAAFIKACGSARCDIYEILEESGVRYVAMEDTGKTWPLQDAKCATLLASQSLNDDIYKIVTSVLLNVSPFVLKLVTAYIRDSAEDDFRSVRELLDVNRRCASEQLNGPHLACVEPMVPTSVAWFRIRSEAHTADELHAYLLQAQVYVLSGRYFYWNDPRQGQRFIRIALARPPEVFEQAMWTMRRALGAYFG
jgi:aspartate/methionine/tyrosine aminotransferase